MAESIPVQCPSCQARVMVAGQQLGQIVACPTCGKPFQATSGGTGVPPQAVNYAGPVPREPTSGMAIASLVLGIPFCIPLFSLLALVFGIIGITKTGPGRARGRGIAIAGTVLGGVGLLLFPLMIAILLPSLNRAREMANRAKCASNMHQVGLAILLYQQDNNQSYPPDLATLCHKEQLPLSALVCPSSKDTAAPTVAQITSGGHLSYVYLSPAAGTSPGATTPVLYESAADHVNDGTNILFGDGHVAWFRMAAAKSILPVGAP